jgi:hypothetical protein
MGIPAYAQEIESYKIRIGTLEVSGRAYIFRSGETVETFDWLTDSGAPQPGRGPRGLRQIGFRSRTGELFEFGEKLPADVVARFAKERPNDAIESLVLEGKAGHRVEINVKGRTPVCRVDLVVSGFPAVLWSNTTGDSK